MTNISKTTITPKAKKLVDTLVATGCTITEASKVAGYKGNSSRVSASRMLRNPEVQKYMFEPSLGRQTKRVPPPWRAVLLYFL